MCPSPSTTSSETRPIRVASVPSAHVYVRHLEAPEGGGRVVRLPDPPPLRARSTDQSRWWPPAILTRGWLEDHADEFDVAHVHFGFDAENPEDLEAWADALDAEGIPFVLTAHDLRNPHHRTPELHEEQLGVLVRRAAQVITLTGAAAAVLRERWGVEATVLPHPHIVDPAWLERPRPEHGGYVVGVHCKSLRANLDPLPVIETLVGMRAEMPDLRLRVDVHTDVMVEGRENYSPGVRDRLLAWADGGEIELEVHHFFDDEALHAYLAGLDVSVLPYRFGTHSGWLEACYDLGTWVIAPTCGFYAEQRDIVIPFVMDEGCYDPASLVSAVRAARERGEAPRPGIEARLAERRRLAQAHEEIYARALTSVSQGSVS